MGLILLNPVLAKIKTIIISVIILFDSDINKIIYSKNPVTNFLAQHCKARIAKNLRQHKKINA